ncbi:MAG: phage tail protein [Defluviitaleaceae bacterium]|nr:phage tail protein [Defluviitaleaceae bacterium]
MSVANKPRIYNQRMELEAVLENGKAGYREVFNGLWTASFTLPADDPKNEYCKPFNYVEIFDERRRIELFRIVGEDFTRAVKGFRTYACEHVIITLLDDVLFKFHQIGNRGVFTPEAINYVLSFQTTQNWRLGRCDFNHQFLYKWESENLLAALFSIPRPFINKWHFTYDTTSYPWTFNLVRAETEIGCELRRRKNMQGVTKNMDVKNLVTRIYPLGYGEGDNQLTIASVNNGVPFLDADTIPIYGVKQSIWTDRRFENADSLMATGSQMLEELKHPYVSYSVESIDLFKRTHDEFDEFREGKMVRVIDRADGIDLDTRIMEIYKPDVTTADIVVVIANKDRNVAGSIAALQERARINETYAQGSETPQHIPFADNAEPGFPAVFEFFIDAGMVNINQARLRVRLEPYRAFSRAIRGGGGVTSTTSSGGGTTQTSTSGGGTTATTTQQNTLTHTTTQQAVQSPTTSTTSTQTPTTSTQAQQAATTQNGGGGTSGASNQTVTGSGGFGTGQHTGYAGSFINFSTVSSTPSQHNHTINQHQHSYQLIAHTHGMAHTHIISAHSHQLTIPGHSHTVTIPGHSHSVTIPAHSHSVTIPAHGHSVTIPAHSHNVTIPPHDHGITLPDHTHDIEFGIVTGERAESISIRVDGNTVPITGSLDDINIIPFLRTDGGGRIVRNAWHRLEIIPNTRTRIAACVFLSVFTNSRGGENL